MDENGRPDVKSLARRAHDTPHEVPVEPFATALENPDQSVRKRAVSGLYAISKSTPDRLVNVVAPLADSLDSESAMLRSKAAMTMGNVAREAPEPVAPHIESLVELLDDESRTVRRSGVHAIERIADSEPEAVVPATASLRRALESDRDDVRASAVDILKSIATDVPGEVDVPVEALLAVLESRTDSSAEMGYDPSMPSGSATPSDQLRGVRSLVLPGRERAENTLVRENAVSILTSMVADDSQSTTAALEPHLQRLFNLLNDPNPTIRGSVAGILSYVAEADSSAVRPAEDALVDILDDPFPASGNAVWALRFVGSERAIGEVRAIANDPDADTDLRETAESALADLQ